MPLPPSFSILHVSFRHDVDEAEGDVGRIRAVQLTHRLWNILQPHGTPSQHMKAPSNGEPKLFYHTLSIYRLGLVSDFDYLKGRCESFLSFSQKKRPVEHGVVSRAASETEGPFVGSFTWSWKIRATTCRHVSSRVQLCTCQHRAAWAAANDAGFTRSRRILDAVACTEIKWSRVSEWPCLTEWSNEITVPRPSGWCRIDSDLLGPPRVPCTAVRESIRATWVPANKGRRPEKSEKSVINGKVDMSIWIIWRHSFSFLLTEQLWIACIASGTLPNGSIFLVTLGCDERIRAETAWQDVEELP